jgi:hypothetical protein
MSHADPGELPLGGRTTIAPSRPRAVLLFLNGSIRQRHWLALDLPIAVRLPKGRLNAGQAEDLAVRIGGRNVRLDGEANSVARAFGRGETEVRKVTLPARFRDQVVSRKPPKRPEAFVQGEPGREVLVEHGDGGSAQEEGAIAEWQRSTGPG